MFRLIKFKAYYLSSILWDLTHLIFRFISAGWRKNCWENLWSGFTCCRYGADFFINTGLKNLMSYWYHFAIMFEALFILTTIDAGTRIGRFVLQESLGKVYKPFRRTNWLPGNLLASFIIVFAWGYFIYTGTVATIWPMFGTANQLLAGIALVIGTSYIINKGKVRYAWVTIIPLVFIFIITFTAGVENIINIYYPQVLNPITMIQGIINLSLTGIIMICALSIFFDAVPKWIKTIKKKEPVLETEPEEFLIER